MDERTDGISRRQLSILLFVSALSPLIRQAPGMAVQSAGSAVWLSALLALVPLPLAGLLLGRLTRKRVPGEGLGGVLLRVFGRFGGAVRSGVSRAAQNARTLRGDRAAAACARISVRVPLLPAGAGRSKPRADIERFSRRCRARRAVAFEHDERAASARVPLRPDGAGAARRAVQPRVSRARSARGAFMRHGRRHVRREAHRRDVLSVFRYDPVRIFRLLERVEALVVAQWVTTDFLLLGALLQAATGELTLCFPKLGARHGAVALTCLALALLSGALCASTSFSLRELSRTLVPIASASAAGVLVLAFVVGLIRKKI